MNQGVHTRCLIVPVFIPHLGCRHRCRFCDQHRITGQVARLPSLDRIRKCIDTFLQYRTADHASAQIAFFGGNFLGLAPSRITILLKMAAGYVESGAVDSIRFSTRPDTIDAQRLSLLKGFPVTTIELGAQSMNDVVLAAVDRGHLAADTISAARRVKAAGYRLGLQLMIGLPGDNRASLMAGARRIIELRPDFVRIYPTVVLAGSRLAEDYAAGRYRPLDLNDAVDQAADLLSIFRFHGIPVIRMGLQADESLADPTTLIAGPWHPAFGHLVYSRIFLRRLIQEMQAAPPPGTLDIVVHPRRDSQIRGLANENLATLAEQYPRHRLHIQHDSALRCDLIRFQGRVLSIWPAADENATIPFLSE